MVLLINERYFKCINGKEYNNTFIDYLKIEYNNFNYEDVDTIIKQNINALTRLERFALQSIKMVVINTDNTKEYTIYIYYKKTKNIQRYIGYDDCYHTSITSWIAERYEESDNIDHNNYKFGDYIEFYYNNHKLKGYIVATEAGLYQHHYGNKNIYEVMYKKCFKWHYIVDDKFIHYDDIIRYIKNDTELVKNTILKNSFFSEEYLEEIKNL